MSPGLLIAVLLGIALGAVGAFLVARSRNAAIRNQATAEAASTVARLEERLAGVSHELQTVKSEASQHDVRERELHGQLASARESVGHSQAMEASLQDKVSALTVEIGRIERHRNELQSQREESDRKVAQLTTMLEAERTRIAETTELLQTAKQQLADHFKQLANDILDGKSAKLTEQSTANLQQLLEPLKEKLRDFQGRLEHVYSEDVRDRSALKEQVQQLVALNQKLTEEADGLTKALKGSSKVQGNWGELVLEKVLESSGLRKGTEYESQRTLKREDGSKGRPDVIVNLPEKRHLIIDAKVSLVAYEEYVNSDDDVERQELLDRHIASMRSHVGSLAESDYSSLCGINTPDCLIMFVPIESAFVVGLAGSPTLWQEALKKSVLIVSPSTLLFVLKTVTHLWRQEEQSRNVQEIASRGAILYDKLAGFVADLQEVGKRLQQAQESYDAAFGRLTVGRGNLIWQAEQLRELGVRPTKQLSGTILNKALDEDKRAEEVDSASVGG